MAPPHLLRAPSERRRNCWGRDRFRSPRPTQASFRGQTRGPIRWAGTRRGCPERSSRDPERQPAGACPGRPQGPPQRSEERDRPEKPQDKRNRAAAVGMQVKKKIFLRAMPCLRQKWRGSDGRGAVTERRRAPGPAASTPLERERIQTSDGVRMRDVLIAKESKLTECIIPRRPQKSPIPHTFGPKTAPTKSSPTWTEDRR